MKKRLWLFVLVVILCCVAWMVYRTFPRSIDETLTGVKYRLGAEGAKAETEPATVVIRGKLHTSLTGKRTFKGEVTVVGDGHQVPVTITGDKLDDYDQLLRLGQSQSTGLPIGKAKQALSAKLFGLEETGPTALGPAVLVSIGIASQNPGSEVPSLLWALLPGGTSV